MLIVDVLASTEAFVGTVCLITVRRSFSGRTDCRRCGKVSHIYDNLFDVCIGFDFC